MPCTAIYKGQQFAIGKDLRSEQFQGDIKLFYYSYDSDRKDSLKKEIEKGTLELFRCLNEGDASVRQLIYLGNKDVGFAEEIISEKFDIIEMGPGWTKKI